MLAAPDVRDTDSSRISLSDFTLYQPHHKAVQYRVLRTIYLPTVHTHLVALFSSPVLIHPDTTALVWWFGSQRSHCDAATLQLLRGGRCEKILQPVRARGARAMPPRPRPPPPVAHISDDRSLRAGGVLLILAERVRRCFESVLGETETARRPGHRALRQYL